MSKSLKIVLNIVIFAVIAGFGFFMVRSMSSDQRTPHLGEEQEVSAFVSPYKQINSFNATSNIENFYVYGRSVFVVLLDRVSVFDLLGNHQHDFSVDSGVRDIAVDQSTIYLLYETRLDQHSFTGQKIGGWEATSPNSDFRALAITENYVFVTDVGGRQVIQYDREGAVVRFLRSPDRFILPNRYAFDIITINDTVFVTNSGRHRIESYTLDGEFITWWGKPGGRPGAFAGCCNPMYIAATPAGNIVTSERGVPRISSYGRDGSFRMVMFDSQALGGGRAAFRMRICNEGHIFIANRNTISVYAFDTARLQNQQKACRGCGRGCRR